MRQSRDDDARDARLVVVDDDALRSDGFLVRGHDARDAREKVPGRVRLDVAHDFVVFVHAFDPHLHFSSLGARSLALDDAHDSRARERVIDDDGGHASRRIVVVVAVIMTRVPEQTPEFGADESAAVGVGERVQERQPSRFPQIETTRLPRASARLSVKHGRAFASLGVNARARSAVTTGSALKRNETRLASPSATAAHALAAFVACRTSASSLSIHTVSTSGQNANRNIPTLTASNAPAEETAEDPTATAAPATSADRDHRDHRTPPSRAAASSAFTKHATTRPSPSPSSAAAAASSPVAARLAYRAARLHRAAPRVPSSCATARDLTVSTNPPSTRTSPHTTSAPARAASTNPVNKSSPRASSSPRPRAARLLFPSHSASRARAVELEDHTPRTNPSHDVAHVRFRPRLRVVRRSQDVKFAHSRRIKTTRDVAARPR